MPPRAPGSLDALLANARVWRGSGMTLAGPARSVPSGHEALDALLPRGGWPQCGLIELLLDEHGIGELQILMPLLRRANPPAGVEDTAAVGEERWIAWLAPPFVPYAPALQSAGLVLERQLIVRTSKAKEVWWAMEQVLRSGTCTAVLGWADKVENAVLRRLKLAADEGGSSGILFRPTRYRSQTSPANVRAVLRGVDAHLEIALFKSQGGRAGRTQVSASGLGVIG